MRIGSSLAVTFALWIAGAALVYAVDERESLRTEFLRAIEPDPAVEKLLATHECVSNLNGNTNTARENSCEEMLSFFLREWEEMKDSAAKLQGPLIDAFIVAGTIEKAMFLKSVIDPLTELGRMMNQILMVLRRPRYSGYEGHRPYVISDLFRRGASRILQNLSPEIVQTHRMWMRESSRGQNLRGRQEYGMLENSATRPLAHAAEYYALLMEYQNTLHDKTATMLGCFNDWDPMATMDPAETEIPFHETEIRLHEIQQALDDARQALQRLTGRDPVEVVDIDRSLFETKELLSQTQKLLNEALQENNRLQERLDDTNVRLSQIERGIKPYQYHCDTEYVYDRNEEDVYNQTRYSDECA